ncbi:MAG: hypothetical protein AAF433_08345 [Bacteroidota bacterium]
MKKLLQNFFTNSWTVTLVGTMLGVFAGIYVNSYYADRQLQQGYDRAIDRIQEELANNQEKIQTNNDTLRHYYEPLNYLFDYLSEEADLVMTREEMGTFQERFPAILQLTDSSQLEDGYYNYNGDFEIDFINLLSIELSDIAWQTFKATSLSGVTAFDCLYQLELTYKIQEKTVEEFEEWLGMFGAIGGGREEFESFLRKWHGIMGYQETLLKMYPDTKACEN